MSIISNDIRNIFRITSCYVAGTIGAGFASGQEILYFFSRFDESSYIGIVISGVLFCLIGVAVLSMVLNYKINSYEELIYSIFIKEVSIVLLRMTEIFAFCVFCIMLAGAGKMISMTLYIKESTALIITAAFCMLIMIFDIRGVALVCEILAPIMICGIIFLCIFLLSEDSVSVFVNYFKANDFSAFCFSILYVSYNSILSIGLLCNMLSWIKKKSVALISGILGGSILFASCLLLNEVMLKHYSNIFESDLPMMTVTMEYVFISYIYKIVLFFSILTTAVSSGYLFAERIGNMMNLKIKVVVIIECIIAIPFAGKGFSELIRIIYPLFGILGLVLISAVLYKYISLIRGNMSLTHQKSVLGNHVLKDPDL